MMNNWFLVKARYTKEFADGTLKRVLDHYLANAMSFTEAEARIHKEVGEYIRGEFSIKAIAKQDFADIFHYDDADVWFKCKVQYITENADSGKEQKVSNNYLVSAKDTKQAVERINESLAGLMVTHEIITTNKTKIIEIFPYDVEFAKLIAENQESDES